MRCPFCGNTDSHVKDSRPNEDGTSIRRRRSCPECDSRFTTFERIQMREIMVIKNNGKKRPFDRERIEKSMLLALRKRPFNEFNLEESINNIVQNIESSGKTEISSAHIGEIVMTKLKKIDKVAYIRFASIYRDFCEAEDFKNFVKDLA